MNIKSNVKSKIIERLENLSIHELGAMLNILKENTSFVGFGYISFYDNTDRWVWSIDSANFFTSFIFASNSNTIMNNYNFSIVYEQIHKNIFQMSTIIENKKVIFIVYDYDNIICKFSTFTLTLENIILSRKLKTILKHANI